MVDWLIQSSAAHSALARGVAPAGMLSDAERQRLAALTHERRRRDWLLGRWAAKRLLQGYAEQCTGVRPAGDAITIASTPDGAPQIVAEGNAALQASLADVSISISHSGGLAFCALAAGRTPIGADIEQIAPRGAQFAADYFTPGELAQLAAAPAALYDTYSTLIWSAKEAALKALRLGLTVDTRDIAIELGATAYSIPGWTPLRAHYRPRAGGPPRELRGCWRVTGGFALTLALTRAP